jgi:hypothetical protein
MRRLSYLFALMAAAYVGAAVAGFVGHYLKAEIRYQVPALCDTDTDCMRFCPPPADDPDCDGGPQT